MFIILYGRDQIFFLVWVEPPFPRKIKTSIKNIRIKHNNARDQKFGEEAEKGGIYQSQLFDGSTIVVSFPLLECPIYTLIGTS